jgi:hypothetical protein
MSSSPGIITVQQWISISLFYAPVTMQLTNNGNAQDLHLGSARSGFQLGRQLSRLGISFVVFLSPSGKMTG